MPLKDYKVFSFFTINNNYVSKIKAIFQMNVSKKYFIYNVSLDIYRYR